MPTGLRWSNENNPTDMIKKITGIVAAAAVAAVIVMTVMHRGEYSSLLFDRQQTEAEQIEHAGDETAAASADEAVTDQSGDTKTEAETTEATEVEADSAHS